ncbi:unnamed protein product [Lampetra fluviatilis]
MVMGNQVERLTHAHYLEVPTADAANHDGDCVPGSAVAYIFTDDEEDEGDDGKDGGRGGGRRSGGGGGDGGKGHGGKGPPKARGRASGGEEEEEEERGGQLSTNEVELSAFHIDECILNKTLAGPRNSRGTVEPLGALSELLPRCLPGDLLEFSAPGEVSLWVVFVGDGYCVSLRDEAVRNETVEAAGGGRSVRLVSSCYQFEALAADAIVRCAVEQVGAAGQLLCWANSECFAAWCRYGRRQFKSGSERRSDGRGPYALRLHLRGAESHALQFHSLEDLVLEKRRLERLGRQRCLHEMTAPASTASSTSSSSNSNNNAATIASTGRWR